MEENSTKQKLYQVTIETGEGQWNEGNAYVYIVSAPDKATARLRAARHAAPSRVDVDPEKYQEDTEEVRDWCDESETSFFGVRKAHCTEIGYDSPRLDDYIIPVGKGDTNLQDEVFEGFQFDFDGDDINRAPNGDDFEILWSV